MLDPKTLDDLMREIEKDFAFYYVRLDTWVYDGIRAKVSLTMTRVYQEGQRDAFLAMGKFMQK